jgi:hypothetical protein
MPATPVGGEAAPIGAAVLEADLFAEPESDVADAAPEGDVAAVTAEPEATSEQKAQDEAPSPPRARPPAPRARKPREGEAKPH